MMTARDTTRVFVWATGQDDNIGDSLLRRAYIQSVLPSTPKHVWVREASQGFVTGLGLRSIDDVERSFGRWAIRILGSALRARTVIAINAGEMNVSARGAGKLMVLALLGLLARVRGGGTIWIGAGVPPTSRHALRALYRFAARTCRFVAWRDDATTATMRVGRSAPDWAFALGDEVPAGESVGRGQLGVVLRADRPAPSEAWWTWIDTLASALKLDVLLVEQVERDRALAERVGAERGYGRLEWSAGSSHAEQEARVREAYRSCQIVIGDRLHGLVVAATEGAVPLGWVESANGKVGRHFDTIGLPFVGRHEGGAVADFDVLGRVELAELRALAATQVAAANAELREVSAAVNARLGLKRGVLERVDA